MKYPLILLLSLLLTSCGSTYIANKVEKNFKGEWNLEDISFPGSSGFFDVELYNVANVNCFQNSLWKFVSNNNTGEFTLENEACTDETQKFTWYIDPKTVENTFPEILFKVTTGEKARRVNTGTRIVIKSLLSDEMIWEQTASLNGKDITIQLTFSKI
jgi:hypothetical protein